MRNQKNLGFIILESAPDMGSYEKPRILSGEYADRKTDEFIIETVLQEAEAPNRNKRIYTKAALQSGINHPMFQEKLARKNLFGEANHPLSDDMKRQQWVPNAHASHVIEKVWWEGNLLKGIVSACTWTPEGQAFAGAGRHGCDLAFSMRGLGGIVQRESNGITRVKDPLIIICYDWVTFPSHSNAYKTKLLKEETGIILPNTSNKPNELVLNEGVLIPCDYMEGLKSYVLDESKQLNDAINQLELDKETSSLTESNGELCVKLKSEEGSTVLFIEDNIRKEVNEFLRKLR